MSASGSDPLRGARSSARWGRRVAPCCLAVLLLIGCSEPRDAPATVAPLRMPGVVQVPGIAPLVAPTDQRTIDDVATYRAADGADRILFSTRSYNSKTYDVGTDGGALRQVPPCGRPMAVTPDGRELACAKDGGIYVRAVADDSPSALRPGPVAPDGDVLTQPAWAPDGRHLVAVTLQYGGCALVIYQASADYATFTATAALALGQVAQLPAGGRGCPVSDVRWSPDGTRLSLLLTPRFGLYLVDLRPLLPGLLRPASPVPVVPVTAGMLTHLTDALTSTPVWTPDGRSLTYGDELGWDIVQRDVATGATSTLLAQHVAGIGPLAWTADGKRLVFVLAPSAPSGTPPPASQLYVYTPGS